MIAVNCDYKIKEDLEFLLESESINSLVLSEKMHISRTTLEDILDTGKANDEAYEKFYSFAYKNNYRLNAVKEEFLKEKYKNILFHGSKNGLSAIDILGARTNCDFGKGFYLGETFNQALSFVCDKANSSVYSFEYNIENLKVKKFECNLEWMLAICLYRGSLEPFSSVKLIQTIKEEVETSDLIIAPIADNKMYYIMTQFTEGEINSDMALHSLSASDLGFQYIFKTEKALKHLKPIERYYLSKPEKDECKKLQLQRSYEIDTKLKLAKREFRNGLYIEELFK